MAEGIDISTTTSAIRGVEATRRIAEQNYDFEEWKITVMKSPILPSNCYCSNLNEDNSRVINLGKCDDNSSNVGEVQQRCQVCIFSSDLNLKHLPEMVFPDNVLHLCYKPSGFTMYFSTLDAMKMISTSAEPIHVACSADWQASKLETGLPTEAAHSFNWTFTSEYKGTIHAVEDQTTVGQIDVDSAEKLDLEKLKQREKILFFEEMTLYEDELHDNGVSNLTVKIRAMPSGFFILLRFFLRVDKVMARMCDTRIHFEVGNTYLLREFQVREESYKNLDLEAAVFSDPNMLYKHLPLVREQTEKIRLL